MPIVSSPKSRRSEICSRGRTCTVFAATSTWRTRVRLPLGRELSRRDIVDAVKATLPMEFAEGYCGNGVSMRVAKHPIFADFRPRS